MNGYSKMKTSSDTKSRSMDFSSDVLSPSSSSPEIRNPKSETPETDLERKQIKNNPITTTPTATNYNNSNKTEDVFSEQEEEEEEEDRVESNINCVNNNIGEKYGGHVKLSRNSTVSASSAASHALQSAVNRAFSMRRSSSVTERYSRIHNDQSVTLASPFEDEDLAVKKKKKSSKSKILQACKKLFGL